MGISVGIVSPSGSGKSTSIIVNHDGTIDFSPEKYNGMKPSELFIINSDKKRLPFKGGMWGVDKKNYIQESDANKIITLLKQISAKAPHIKAVYIDTISGIMQDFEMLEKKKSFNSWMELAAQIYEIITVINDELRDNLIVYLSAHVSMQSDIDANNIKSIMTNGRKLEKIKLESKLPIVLYGKVRYGSDGDNEYLFETQANMSTAKTPYGMIKEFEIPNSLSLVDKSIREYYDLK